MIEFEDEVGSSFPTSPGTSPSVERWFQTILARRSLSHLVQASDTLRFLALVPCPDLSFAPK